MIRELNDQEKRPENKLHSSFDEYKSRPISDIYDVQENIICIRLQVIYRE